MSPILKDVQADLILPALKVLNTRQLFHVLSEEVALRAALPADIVFEELMTKEAQHSSAIGNGVAIPHLKMKGLQEPLMMLVRLEDGISFASSLDGQDVDLVFLLISPERDGPLHLRRLSRISRILADETLLRQLRIAPDMHAMRALMMSPESTLLAA